MWLVRKILVLTFVTSCIFFVHSAYGVSKPAELAADVELQQVALFKNGLGFFISEVSCPPKKASFSFVPAAAPCHGTFWVAYPPKIKVENLTVKEIETEKMIEAISLVELIRANVGKKVVLSFDAKGESTIKGVIKSFAQDHHKPMPNPYAPGVASSDDGYRYRQPVSRGTFVMLKTDAGEVAVDPQRVVRIDFIEGSSNKTFKGKSKSMQVGVKLAKPAEGKKLLVSYLGKGVTWAPSYMVDITNSDKAVISAKAVVINEVCDLDGVKVQLITGFPHLQFADIISPLAMKEDLARFLQSLVKGQSERGRMGGIASNVMKQSVYWEAGEDRSSMMPAYGAAQMGKAAEDLFFYPLENVHLSKGEVGYLPLFTESVPYTHIYRWEIPDYLNPEQRNRYDRRGEEKVKGEEVWHCLRMKNKSKVPWTTAPAEIVKQSLILGQDTLNYTPVEGKTTLRITRAIGVKAEQSELEIERQRDATRLYGYHYDLVTLDGKLSVTNFLDKTVNLEITKTLSGEVKSSKPQAEIKKLAQGLRNMNGVKKLTWTIELESGQSKEISYVYEVYIRR